MSVSANDLGDGVLLTGSQFSEPMRVVGNPSGGDGFVLVNLVGTRTSTFRGGVTLTRADLGSIEIERKEALFGGKPRLFKLGLEALRMKSAWLMNAGTFTGSTWSHCDTEPRLEEPIKDPARFPWHEVRKIEHYRLDVNALAQPLEFKEEALPYGGRM